MTRAKRKKTYAWREMDRLIDTTGLHLRFWMVPREKGHEYQIRGPAKDWNCSFTYGLRSGYVGQFVGNALPATPLVIRLFNAQRYAR